MTWLLEGRPLQRVLVTRLRYLGDVVMATVVADALRRGDPDVQVGFLCEASHAPVLAGHPSIDRLHRLGAMRQGRDAEARRAGDTAAMTGAAGTLGTIAALRAAGYDLAVDLFFNPRSAWLLRLAGIPQRIGGTTRSRRRLYTHAVPRSGVDDPGGVLARRAPGGLGEHLCRLAPLVHGPSGQPFVTWLGEEAEAGPVVPRLVPPPRSRAGQAALARAGIAAGRPYALLAPGATWPAKEWPAERWPALADRVEQESGLPAVLVVPPGRGGNWPGVPRVLDPLPLTDLLPLLAGAALVVAVDGGVMHAAVAYGAPVVGLFGPTDPAIWFPYGEGTRATVLASRPPCHPCSRHACPAGEFICLPGIGPDDVLKACAKVMAHGAPRTGETGNEGW